MAAEVSQPQTLEADIVSLGTRNGIEMAIARRTAKTLGKIIAKPNSPDLIEGVLIEPLQVYPDDRGFFCELARLGKGLAEVFLYDLRRNSRTFGAINTIFAGRFQPWEILIPPGGAQGYKALGVEPIQLVYFTDRHYNPADELRLPYNHPDIAYDWEIQHK